MYVCGHFHKLPVPGMTSPREYGIFKEKIKGCGIPRTPYCGKLLFTNCLLHRLFCERERATQARTGSEYGTGTRGTGRRCEARGVMGRRKIFLSSPSFPAPPLFVLYFARATGEEAGLLILITNDLDRILRSEPPMKMTILILLST